MPLPGKLYIAEERVAQWAARARVAGGETGNQGEEEQVSIIIGPGRR